MVEVQEQTENKIQFPPEEPQAERSIPKEIPQIKIKDLPEERGNRIDVQINDMEWEVEPEPQPEPAEEEVYSGRDYQEDGDRIEYSRAINKHLFTWLFSFFLGMYGADRFFRGQVGLGVLKLLTFGGFGFWYLADVLIAAGKSYSGGFKDMDDVFFDEFGRYVL